MLSLQDKPKNTKLFIVLCDQVHTYLFKKVNSFSLIEVGSVSIFAVERLVKCKKAFSGEGSGKLPLKLISPILFQV